MGRLAEAAGDLQQVLALQPHNAEAKRLLQGLEYAQQGGQRRETVAGATTQ